MKDFTQFSTFLLPAILFTVFRPLLRLNERIICMHANINSTHSHCAVCNYLKMQSKYGWGWGVHHMHICIQINDENNDLIKVFMTFIYDDEMKNCKIIEEKKMHVYSLHILKFNVTERESKHVTAP